MRWLPLAFTLLLAPVAPARAQVSVGLSIGIHVPVYPELVLVPGTPVYYAPRADLNYFFYDGLYWVLAQDGWYASSWYDGPWYEVSPVEVPVYLLRVPVRYYQQPPPYFRGWRPDHPPRWGHHYGRDWERRRAGWERWDRRAVPRAAPLPTYQRQYSGERYPRTREHQGELRAAQYRYRPRESVARQQYRQQGDRSGPRADPRRQELDRSRAAPSPMRGEGVRQPQRYEQRPQLQPGPRSEPRQRERAEPQEPRRERRSAPQERGRDGRDDERGGGRR